ncbi:TonB-dependent receptor plug domain-containing protein [Alcanivorax hongdengensis]|nr:TonB-dependent receptor [Alcanivorax hongdengensis]
MMTAPSDIPQVVLTPARVSEPQSEVPASVTVIDRQLINASGARELYQVLRLVPGMTAVKVDGNVPTVSYHATKSTDIRRMLVLIDGRSVYQPGLARVSWNDLPVDLNDVERIEVTRGPAAAAYGANAYTGVINIITRDPRDVDGQQVTLRGGNNGVADGRVSAGQHFSGGAWRVNLAQRADDGYDEPFEGREARDAKHITTLNAEWVRELDERNTLTLQAGGTKSRLQRPGALEDAGVYSQLPVQHTQRAFGAIQWQHAFSDDHQLQVNSYGQYNNEQTPYSVCYRDPFDPNQAVGPGGALLFSKELRDLFVASGNDLDTTLANAASDPALLQRYMTVQGAGAPFCADSRMDIEEIRYDLEVQDTLQINDRLRLVSGVDVRSDRTQSQYYLSGNAENSSYRAFGNLAVTVIDPVIVNLGGYWEHDTISGENFSPRVGVNWAVVPGHHLRYVFSKAVRTPDIYEDQADINILADNLSEPFASQTQSLLGWSRPAFFVTQQSPGTMKPEEIRSWELGYYGRFAGLEMDVRYFHESLTNLLSDPLTPFEFDVNNEGRVDHRGTEGQVTWRPISSQMLRLTAAHLHSRSNDNTERRMMTRDSGSALWAWQMTSQWGFSTTYYLARSYNDHPFEQLNLQLLFRQPIGNAQLQWRATLEHPLNSEPVVFPENRYQDDNRYWLSATVSF